MYAPNPFLDLIRRVRAGDAAAAHELVALYEPAIRRAARIRLVDPRLRRHLDSMDICQSVFASFFVRAALGQYQLETPEQLLHLLVSMSRKKLVDQARRQGAQQRDYHRAGDERRLAQTADKRAGDPAGPLISRELLGEFRKRLSEEERFLADQRANEREWVGIAGDLNMSPEAARKKLTRAIDRVARELGMEGFEDE